MAVQIQNSRSSLLEEDDILQDIEYYYPQRESRYYASAGLPAVSEHRQKADSRDAGNHQNMNPDHSGEPFGQWGARAASPDGALNFLFGVFGLMMWYMPQADITPALLLSGGMVWIILAFGAFAASLLNFFRGKPKGNINIMMSLLIGFFPGLNMLITCMAMLMNIHYSPAIFGIVYIIGSIFTFGVALKRLDKPLYRPLCTFSLCFGLFFFGLGDLFGIRLAIQTGAWGMLLFAILTFYYALSVMYMHYNARLPQGKSWKELMGK